jgi:hypothetical protein
MLYQTPENLTITNDYEDDEDDDYGWDIVEDDDCCGNNDDGYDIGDERDEIDKPYTDEHQQPQAWVVAQTDLMERKAKAIITSITAE